MRIASSTLSFTLLLGVCAGLPALSIDLSAPTLTILPSALGTTIAVAGLSLSLFMVGFATGQFAGGRGSDLIGRRPVLQISITVYILSGICCALATSGAALVMSRFVQGIGAGACAVQATAMVQDLFTGEAARRKQSYVSVVLTILPMLAPSLGTLFIANFGWRSVHVVLAVAGMMLATVITLFIGESRPARAPDAKTGWGLRDSVEMMHDKVFRRATLVNALSYGAIFAYIAGAPVVVMEDLGQSSTVYAALFAATALALGAGAMTNAALGRRGLSVERIVWSGLIAQSGATAALVVVGGDLASGGIFVAVPALLMCAYARGLLSPNLVHLAVSRYRDRAGLASALVGLLQLLVGAAASALVAALLAPFGYDGVVISMAVLACAAAIVWRMTQDAERLGESRTTEGQTRPRGVRG